MTRYLKLPALLLLAFLFSCRNDNEPTGDSAAENVIENYGDIVWINYTDAYEKALDMHAKLEDLVGNPSEQTLLAAQESWIAARPTYLQTEAFRMYAGPIDDENGPEGKLNGWPMDEAYVDYVQGNTESGIINRSDLFPVISEQTIADLNEKDGETNISSGYHAVEFLLWGQDLNARPEDAGLRTFRDYVKGEGENAERRGQYLLAASRLILSDLEYLIEQWKPQGFNFRKDFKESAAISVRKIVQGLKELSAGELAGERMQVALETRNQEDEHSCFSDNTHNDHLYDLIGIINVYEGKYVRPDGTIVSGPGLSDLVKAKNPALDEEVKQHLALTKSSVESILPPFDQAVLSATERPKIEACVKNLRELGDKFLKVYEVVK